MFAPLPALSCKLPQHAQTILFCRNVPPVEKPKVSGKDQVLQMSELSAEFYNGSKSGWVVSVSLPIAILLQFKTQQAEVKWDSDSFLLLERHVRKDPRLVEWLP